MIGAVASITFGWLMTGHYVWAAAGLSALDWFLINLANEVTDIEEDLKRRRVHLKDEIARKLAETD